MLWIRQYICVQQARLKRLAAGKGEKQDFTAEATEFAEFGVFLNELPRSKLRGIRKD